jgi:hypothetical protein
MKRFTETLWWVGFWTAIFVVVWFALCLHAS